MKIHKSDVNIPTHFVDLVSTLPDGSCFFDIETTGLSWRTSHIYLLGLLRPKGSSWQLTQWFLDSPTEEAKLLQLLQEALSGLNCCYHYNGSSFDLPYLEHKCSFYHLPLPTAELTQVDLYRRLQPFRFLFPDSRMRQTDAERLAGWLRDDTSTGGELISVYRQYLCTGDQALADRLLLHNHDDLLGMSAILALLSFEQLGKGAFKARTVCRTDTALTAELTPVKPLPTELSLKYEGFSLYGPGETLRLQIPVCSETLKYFFSDYRQYYYLPQEDTAVHKSIGRYVDRAYRRPASKTTCYQKFDDSFVPLPPGAEPLPDCPLFRRNANDASGFHRLTDILKQEHLHTYLKQILTTLNSKWTDT